MIEVITQKELFERMKKEGLDPNKEYDMFPFTSWFIIPEIGGFVSVAYDMWDGQELKDPVVIITDEIKTKFADLKKLYTCKEGVIVKL